MRAEERLRRLGAHGIVTAAPACEVEHCADGDEPGTGRFGRVSLPDCTTSSMLGGVLGWALSEHNARLANVESAMNSIAEAQTRLTGAQARAEGEIKAIHERLDGFEERVDKRLAGPNRDQHRQADPTVPGRRDDAAGRPARRIAGDEAHQESNHHPGRRGDAPRSMAGSPSRLRRRPAHAWG